MLIYSEERLVPTDVNMMVLSAPGGGYFYIHRALYDQAVVIDDIYHDTVELLIEALTGKQDTRQDVVTFMENTPTPISILGPFLLLVKSELEEFQDMVGAIHVMSGPINLRKLLKIPYDMRNTPSFSLSIREEYELAWDRFFKTTMPYGAEVSYVQTQYAPMNGTATATVEEEYDEEEYDDPYDSDDPDALLAALDADFAAIDAKSEEEKEEYMKLDDDEEEPEPLPAPIPEPEPVPVAEAPKAKTGLELLMSGGI